MKVTKKELKSLGKQGLDAKLHETREALMKIRAQAAGGSNPKDLHAIKNLKKTIARALTLKKQMEEKQ